jgi:spoIIIJ-associated protein
MDSNEKEHKAEDDEVFEVERERLHDDERTDGSVGEGVQILEEFDRQRREGKIEYVQSILEGILYRMGLDAEVSAEEVGPDIRLEMRGDNTGLLIGKHGKTLDAIQYILNKMYQRRFGEGERVFVDSENYRKRRVEALENLAHRLGEKVKKRKRTVVAGVFNSRDRRVIHMALRDDDLLETESSGEGFYKKLVIRPAVRENRDVDLDTTS